MTEVKEIQELKEGTVFSYEGKKYKLRIFERQYLGVDIVDLTINFFCCLASVEVEVKTFKFEDLEYGQKFKLAFSSFDYTYTKTNFSPYAIYNEFKIAKFNLEDKVYKVN
jgi:hypothetical protein